MFRDAIETYEIIISFFAVGLFISTVEYLTIVSQFGATGIYAWKLHNLEWNRVFRKGPLGRGLSAVYGNLGIGVMLSLRLVCLLALVLVPVPSPAFSVAMTAVVVTMLISNARHLYGGDGSDQMFTILAVTLLLCVVPWSSPFQFALGIWFIAAQSVLSYCAAGIAKLISAEWRSGEAVYRIFNTCSRGRTRVRS